jgi:hypothetical protein
LAYNISPKTAFPPHTLRIAKVAKQKSRINAKAKGEQNQSQIVQPPYLKLKRKPRRAQRQSQRAEARPLFGEMDRDEAPGRLRGR